MEEKERLKRLSLDYKSPLSPTSRERCLKQSNNLSFYNFMNIWFFINRSSLVYKPKSDSDVIVEIALKCINRSNAIEVKLTDLFCGSGALGLTIKKLSNKKIKLTGIDVHKDSIKNAKANSLLLGLNGSFIQEDILNIPFLKSDIIIANPPYIRKKIKGMDYSQERKESLFGNFEKHIMSISNANFIIIETEEEDLIPPHGFKKTIIKDCKNLTRGSIFEKTEKA